VRGWQAPAPGVRHSRRWAATVVMLVVAALTGGLIAAVTAVTAALSAPAGSQGSAVGGVPVPAVRPAATSEVTPAAAAPVGQAVPRGEPIRVLIPAVDVDVELVRLGLRPDRAMEVPQFGLAGWYAEGPRPGHPGPAVLAAHVDSWAGPDVFFRLRDLVAGDRVHVLYDSGDVVTFVVTTSEQTPKDELPVASIWPHTDDRMLTLITCGGTFDRAASSYQDNVVVYTAPLGVAAADGGTTGMRSVSQR
jgi:hypothetical protein